MSSEVIALPKKKSPEIKNLYYITHVDNLASIFKFGILSHQTIENKKMTYVPIYDASIVSNRKIKMAPNGKTLWQFANLYFQARNPMLYRVIHEKEGKIVVLGVKKQVIQNPGVYLTNGNAASDSTDFYTPEEGLKVIARMWDAIEGEWWNSLDGSKRKIMAECLVPEGISPEMIHSIYVPNHKVAEDVRAIGLPGGLPVIPEPDMFFLPASRHKISSHLSLAEGDMFFSNMQTLTVSVNTVGIMGKGLAARAKYQFPDVYVAYQDACRNKTLRMGKPFLYKREASFESELADEPGTGTTIPNGVKWFLLFATKKHWSESSDLQGIDEGLTWIASHYKTDGIRSIALPALGCGLGNLQWKDVGPMMCRRLSGLEIDVVIYLPRERELLKEHLSADYLLGGQ